MHGLIIEAIARGGYFGIFVLMVLENVFPPIPSEVIMGIGGVLVARGDMTFWPLMIAGTLGTVAGNYAWYWIGDRWGYERTRPFVDRWGRWLTIDRDSLAQSGGLAIYLGERPRVAAALRAGDEHPWRRPDQLSGNDEAVPTEALAP